LKLGKRKYLKLISSVWHMQHAESGILLEGKLLTHIFVNGIGID